MRLISWVSKHLLDLAFGTAITLFIGWVLRHLGILTLKLGENAVLGAIDDQIAAHFGLTAPLVVGFLWNWAIPPTLAAIAIWTYHLLQNGAWTNAQGRKKLLGLALITLGGIAVLAGLSILVGNAEPSESAASAASPSDAPTPRTSMLSGRPGLILRSRM